MNSLSFSLSLSLSLSRSMLVVVPYMHKIFPIDLSPRLPFLSYKERERESRCQGSDLVNRIFVPGINRMRDVALPRIHHFTLKDRRLKDSVSRASALALLYM